MTQPRKEQINDQRSYYTRIDSVGVTTPVPFGTPDVAGGTVQTYHNTSENYYTELLAKTITGIPGGAESDSSAFFFGNSGPFTSPVASGATFTITIPNINSGNPVSITFQASDVVIISAASVISTSKAAARINAALTVAGVSPSSPVAQNINGQLVLQSADSTGYTTGTAASITVSDVTIGVCAALGFTSGASATATGITSPQRGIITSSTDGLGGYVQFRMPDASPAITKSNVQIGVGGFGHLPLYPPGQPIYGRLQQFQGLTGDPKFKISYFRQGAVPGKIVSNGGNFSTLLNTDQLTIQVSTVNPALYPSNPSVQFYAFVTTFNPVPTSPQDVVNLINTAWNAVAAGAGFPTGTEAGRGGITGSVPGPWEFSENIDEFWISLNGHAPIQIAPGNGLSAGATSITMTTQDLVTYINTQIGLAGQGAQGTASGTNGSGITISSSLTSGQSSTVQIFAADPLGGTGTTTTTNVTMLDKLGISPGVYAGSSIAKLYGNDEIQLVCPDHTLVDPYGNPSQITAIAATGVMAKLGITGTPSGGNTTAQSVTNLGQEPVTPPVMQAMIPEMMFFGEVPENIETTSEQFLTTDGPTPIVPGQGTGNLGVSPLLGLDGKVNPDLIKKILDVMSVDSMNLGARLLSNLIQNDRPRITTPYNDTLNRGMTLLWQGTSVSGTTGSNPSQISRVYSDTQGNLWITNNARQDQISITNPPTWTKDTSGQSSSAIFVSQNTASGVPKAIMLYSPSTDSATGFFFLGQPGHAAPPPIAFDPSSHAGNSQGYIQVGSNTDFNDSLTPRLNTPMPGGTITLLWQTPPQTVSGTPLPGIRIYTTQQLQFPTGAGTNLWLTINARWPGGVWVKDVLGIEAEALLLWQSMGSSLFGPLTVFYQAAADDAPWASWGTASSNSIPLMNINGIANVTSVGTLAAGATLINASTARMITETNPPVGGASSVGRTLVWQTLATSPLGVLRIYHGNTSGTGGTNAQSEWALTGNASYANGSPGLWTQDDPLSESWMIKVSGTTIAGTSALSTMTYLHQLNSIPPWNDGGWIGSVNLSHQTLFSPGPGQENVGVTLTTTEANSGIASLQSHTTNGGGGGFLQLRNPATAGFAQLGANGSGTLGSSVGGGYLQLIQSNPDFNDTTTPNTIVSKNIPKAWAYFQIASNQPNGNIPIISSFGISSISLSSTVLTVTFKIPFLGSPPNIGAAPVTMVTIGPAVAANVVVWDWVSQTSAFFEVSQGGSVINWNTAGFVGNVYITVPGMQ